MIKLDIIKFADYNILYKKKHIFMFFFQTINRFKRYNNVNFQNNNGVYTYYCIIFKTVALKKKHKSFFVDNFKNYKFNNQYF